MMQMRAFRRIVILALPLALAACAAPSQYKDDPNYQIGYSQGCTSATNMVPGDKSTITRDEHAYANDEAYRAGWKKGFNACKVKSGGGVDMPNSTGRGSGPDGGF
ncbi:MAG: hypothetical protein WBN97_05320 [Parvibaculum sp.]